MNFEPGSRYVTKHGTVYVCRMRLRGRVYFSEEGSDEKPVPISTSVAAKTLTPLDAAPTLPLEETIAD